MKKQVAILGLTLAIGATALVSTPSDASARTIPQSMRGTWYSYDKGLKEYSVLKISAQSLKTSPAWEQSFGMTWYNYNLSVSAKSKTGWVRGIPRGNDDPFYLRHSTYRPAGYSVKLKTLQFKHGGLYQRYTKKKVRIQMQKWV